jgi:hypothetical protein
VLEVFSIFALSIIIFQWWIYNDKRSFKKYVLTDFKGKSKFFVFMYKFLALVYIGGGEGRTGGFNYHADKNIEIFGKKYMRITGYIMFLGITSAVLLPNSLILKYQIFNAKSLIKDFNNQTLSFSISNGLIMDKKLIKKINNKNKYLITIDKTTNKKEFIFFINREQKINIGDTVEIKYIEKYDEKISIKINDKIIQKFDINESYKYLKNAYKNKKLIEIYGLIMFLIAYLLLWSRYNKYGFQGINNLIKIKKQEYTNNLTTQEK